MRKAISHGSGEQMLEAFKQKLDILDTDFNDVESATSIKAAHQKPSKFAHGTADQMINAFEAKIDELEGGVSASAKIEASDEPEDIVNYLSPQDEERFIHTLVGDVNTELEDLDIFDSWSWDYTETELILTAVIDSEVDEYTVPREDLTFDWDTIEDDVQYIVRAITNPDEEEFAEDVTSATVVEAADDDKSVVIPDYAKTEYYADAQGSFGGDEKDIYSLEDIMIMWNSEHNNDPSMAQYSSFEDWWEDTKRWMKPSSTPEEGEDDEMFTDNDGIFGEPGEIISKRDMRDYYEESRDTDPSLAAFDSFEDWWAATSAMLEPVEDEDVMSATSVNSSSGFYALVAEDGTPILIFEADDLDDANAQVADYNNIYKTDYSVEYDDAVDTDGLDLIGRLSEEEGPVGSGFTEIASKQVEDSDGFMTDYTMYRDTETGEYVFVFGDKDSYAPEQGDFDWSCDTEQEAWDWFNDYQGFGEEDEDEYYDDDDDIYSAEDVTTDDNDVMEWFENASASVMDADWTTDGEIIVSLDHNVRDVETTAAELISCIEPNGYHVSDWNVNGSNVFIFEVISSDQYFQLTSDTSYISEDNLITDSTASYSPFTLDELVNYYSQQDMMTDEEIWDEIVAQYHDEDLANDVLEAL